MTDLVIVVPVLRRPKNVWPLVDSILKSTPPCRIEFIVDDDDHAEREAVEQCRKFHYLSGARSVITHISLTGSYATKINAGVEASAEPVIFSAADDLNFHPGWFEAAKRHFTDQITIVGVNDLCAPRVQNGEHATHFLMKREYALQPCADGSRGPMFEGYHHWFCDDEIVATARHRGAIAFATDSIVEHLHPMVGKAEDDDVYQLGRSQKRSDRLKFQQRQELWAA